MIEGHQGSRRVSDRRPVLSSLKPLVKIRDDGAQRGGEVAVAGRIDHLAELANPLSQQRGQKDRPGTGEGVLVIAEELDEADDAAEVTSGDLVLFLHPVGKTLWVRVLPDVLVAVHDHLTPTGEDDEIGRAHV